MGGHPTAEDLGRHERTVLRLLRDSGPRSRTALAVEMGLSGTTLTRVVGNLLAWGYIVEQGTAANVRIGRPAIDLRAVPSAVVAAGIQLGVGTAHVGLTDGLAEIHRQRSLRFDTTDAPRQVLDLVATACKALLRDAGDACVAIGVGAPGPVDTKKRTNLMSVNLGWRHVPIADLLEERLGLPVYVDHNVRTMALAEALYGGHDVDDLAYVYVNTGLGLGLVLDRRPFYAGLHGLSELGHIRAVDRGNTCTCGARGCLETVVSEGSLRTQLAAAGLTPTARDQPPLALLEAGATGGDRAARQIRGRLIRHLASALANVVNLFNPQLILLGGIFEAASDVLVNDLHAATDEAVYPFLRGEFHIRRPSLRNAGVVGAAALALEEVIYADK